MAHMAKYDSGAAPALISHYERTPEIERGYVRENIDNSRTYLNENLKPCDIRFLIENAKQMSEQKNGRKVRRDVNVMCDWVVTAPADLKTEDLRVFFPAVLSFLEKRYGADNVAGAYIHNDETTPHGHFPIIPMVNGRLCAKEMFTRADLKMFHKDLNAAVDEELGYHVSIELDDTQKTRKALSKIGGMDNYIATDNAIKKQERKLKEVNLEVARAEKNLECSRRSNKQKSQKVANLTGSLNDLLGLSNVSGDSLIDKAEAFCRSKGI